MMKPFMTNLLTSNYFCKFLHQSIIMRKSEVFLLLSPITNVSVRLEPGSTFKWYFKDREMLSDCRFSEHVFTYTEGFTISV